MSRFRFGGSAIKSSPTVARLPLSVVAITLALVPVAHVSAIRTFVASTGNDANTSTNCPPTAPCRTFSAAYGVTSSGGEIVAQDVAGFGTLTITMPLTITGARGAQITVANGATGVVVDVPGSSPGNAVHLNNVEINGDFAGSNTGIQLIAGTLIVENSSIKFLNVGMTVAANTKSDLINTDVIGNATGITTSGTGTDFDVSPFTTYGPTQVRVTGGSVVDNTVGVLMRTPGNDGYQVFETVLFNNSNLPTVAGNGTLATCTGIVAVGGNTPVCNSVGLFGNAYQNGVAVH